MNYLNLIHINKNFYGYNELDFSFIVSENVCIPENFTCNIVKKKDNDYISKVFEPGKHEGIIFENNSNIFLEIKSTISKSNIEELLNDLKSKSLRFDCAYRNCAYNNVKSKFSKVQNYYFLFYNDNRKDLFMKIRKNMNLKNDIEICYSSVNVQISSIVSLQNQIREINTLMKTQGDKIKLQDDKIKTQDSLISKLWENNLINNYKFNMMEIKLFNTKEETIKTTINTYLQEKSINVFKFFQDYNEKFEKGYESINKYNEFKEINSIVTLNNKIFEGDELNINYITLINSLNSMIENMGGLTKEYYEAYRDALVGKPYLTTHRQKLDFPVCTPRIEKVLKNIVKFIYLLEDNKDLLFNFWGAILYHAIDICENDRNYDKLYLINFTNDVKRSVIYLIRTINPTFI